MEEVILGVDLVMANCEAAHKHYRSECALESGDLVLNVGFQPLALLQEKELSQWMKRQLISDLVCSLLL